MAIGKVLLLLFAIQLFSSFVTVDASVTHLVKKLKNWWNGEKQQETVSNPLPLQARTHMLHKPKNLSIYIASWNVNAKLDQESELQDWLCAEAVWQNPPDIYAIALQELIPLTALHIMKNETHPDGIAIEKLLSNLCGSTHKTANYQEVKSARLVGMMLTVFIRKELVSNVLQSSTGAVGTGSVTSAATGVSLELSQMGNKGGVGVGLLINDVWVCFVNSHLTAHDENVNQRNQDQMNIEHKMVFKYKEGNSEIQKSIYKHEVFWMGDLNYRPNTCLSREVFDMHINPKYTGIVHEHDQLYLQKSGGLVFGGYHENDITFKPTYKYDPGTDNWDSSKKIRCPAWCDRILWKGQNIRQHAYTSVPTLKVSDHKPIFGVFESSFMVNA